MLVFADNLFIISQTRQYAAIYPTYHVNISKMNRNIASKMVIKEGELSKAASNNDMAPPSSRRNSVADAEKTKNATDRHDSHLHTESTFKVEFDVKRDHSFQLPLPFYEGRLEDVPDETRRKAFAAKRARYSKENGIPAFYKRILSEIGRSESNQQGGHAFRSSVIESNTAKSTEHHSFYVAHALLRELEIDDSE